MKNPTPYFEIPYPYEETRKQKIIEYTNELIEKFKKKWRQKEESRCKIKRGLTKEFKPWIIEYNNERKMINILKNAKK